MINIEDISIIKLKEMFQEAILDWAKENLREYPWRKNITPYKVLISEILLTRTSASQVLPVYNDFLKEYPNLDKFLDADYNPIFKLIESLGLIYRANRIIKLKTQLINEFDRKIPNNFDDLKKLPGIGDYNANAILCFGFKKKRALLDNNFIRVYQRVFNVKSRTKTPKTDKFLWGFSESLLPTSSYIRYNYGVLDFGGIFCLPKIPKCQTCFISEICFYKKTIDLKI